MHLVILNEGRLEVRWTWLPYWLAAGPALSRDVERLMNDVVIMNGMPPTEESLGRISTFVVNTIVQRFPIPGLREYIDGIRHVQERS